MLSPALLLFDAFAVCLITPDVFIVFWLFRLTGVPSRRKRSHAHGENNDSHEDVGYREDSCMISRADRALDRNRTDTLSLAGS